MVDSLKVRISQFYGTLEHKEENWSLDPLLIN